MWFPSTDQKSLRASLSSVIVSNVWDPSDSPWRLSVSSCRVILDWEGFADTLISSRQCDCSTCYRESENFTVFGVIVSFASSLGAWICDPLKNCPAPQRLQPKYLLSKFTQHTMHIRGIFQVKCSCQIGEAWTGLVQKSDSIFNHCSKRNHWTFKWFSEFSLTRSFPICQPFFKQAGLQQHRWRPFFYSANRSVSCSICLGSTVCWSTMIPW